MKIENKNYKDTVFRLLCKNKKVLLELYNALNGTDYNNDEDLIVTTMEGETFLGMKNDVSFVFSDDLNLYEHQSSACPNIPLRNLFYVSSIYREQIDIGSTYKAKMIGIPTPRFVVFYNGTAPMEDEKTYRLSDMFLHKEDVPELELIVKQYNVNEGHSSRLLEACKTLKEYSHFVSYVRKYIKEEAAKKTEKSIISLEEKTRKDIIKLSVTRAIEKCIDENILKDFLMDYRKEVLEVGLFEYSAERHLQLIQEESFESGCERGAEKHLISQICKKMKVGKNIETIASEVEETVEAITPIYNVAQKYSPDYNVDSIYNELNKQ